MVSGKDSSNMLMADNLPKIVWSSTHHVTLMKSWLVQKQTALGKDKSNPLTVDSLVKTIWSSIHHLLINEVLTILGYTTTEAAIREVLRLDDAEGVDCLPNEEIFTELARMGYEKPSTKLTFYKDFFSIQWKFLIHTILQSMSSKRTSWNEFSSSMVSAVICLSTALDACATLTRRVEHLEYNKVTQALEITNLKRRVKKLEKGNKERMIAEMDKDDVVVLMYEKEENKKVEEAKVVESAQEDETEPAEVQEVVDVVTTAKLITEVVTAASEIVTAVSAIIPTAEPQVFAATLTAAPATVAAAPSRRRKGVVIRDPKEESTTSASTIIPETKSKDKGKGILVEEHKPLKKKQQIEMDEEYARKLHAELNKDID
uniref:Synaptobrevin, longin-like domain protein n=1 Tax=Tanacetum cinerariifolium TaxID=118510 RepID=A0A6L2LTN1_TANCI|nr:hypothetical protein [Tanacetum cinerariifolium]